jgi:hypothetical protein
VQILDEVNPGRGKMVAKALKSELGRDGQRWKMRQQTSLN